MTSTSGTNYEGRRRFSVAHLLVAIMVMFVVLPFVDLLSFGNLVEAAVFTIVLVAAIAAVGGRRRTLMAAAVLATPALLTRWLNHLWPNLLPVDFYLVTAAVFVALVVAHLFRFVVTAPVVNEEVLCGAVCVYLLIAVVWSFLYTLLARWQPDSFVFAEPSDAKATMAGFVATYFSLQIITTIAFGDIMPLTNIARMTTLLEGITGILYMAILISRLVGVYKSGRESGESGG